MHQNISRQYVSFDMNRHFRSLRVHSANYISFQNKWDMIVVTVFISISNQMRIPFGSNRWSKNRCRKDLAAKRPRGEKSGGEKTQRGKNRRGKNRGEKTAGKRPAGKRPIAQDCGFGFWTDECLLHPGTGDVICADHEISTIFNGIISSKIST